MDPSSSRREPREAVRYSWKPTDGETDIPPVIDPRLYGEGGDTQDDAPIDINALPVSQRRLLQERFNASEESEEYEESDVAPEEDESSDEEMDDLPGLQEPPSEDDEDGRSWRRRRRRSGPFSGRFGARGGKGIPRGPRKPLEPSPEFKMLHSQATEAFIDGDYDRAINLVQQAILINPEIFAAHSLLSEIFLARGERDKAITALFSGAHTRPRDPSVWHKVAKLILERSGEDRQSALNDVIYCYSRVIDLDQKNYNVRFQRAAIYRELGHNGKAAAEYERILKDLPHNVRALRHLAETYIDMNEPQKALDHYLESVRYYTNLEPTTEMLEFSWSDVNICVELFIYTKRYEEGLRTLRYLSRWLLDRKEDTMWEGIFDDDREWDADHFPRRIKTTGFDPDRYPLDSYGQGLPMELRIKLGVFRLKLGDRYFDEALRHFEWLDPEDNSPAAKLWDYADLFREAADALKESGLFEEAMRYYRPLQLTEEYADVGYFMAMGDCAFAYQNYQEAESCYLTVVEHDATNMAVRVSLAKLYEALGMHEEALKYVNQAVRLGWEERGRRGRRRDHRIGQLAREFQNAEGAAAPKPLAPKPAKGAEADTEQPADVQYLYTKMMELRPAMRRGDPGATEDWLDIADALLRDFRGNRVFFPLQRHTIFLGYSKDATRKAGAYGNKALMDEMSELAGRLQETMRKTAKEDTALPPPNDYYGISFDEWLDIFLEYAFVVSGQGEAEEAYSTLAAAAEASVWYHDREKIRQIHVCWMTCAIRLGDEDMMATEARWFIKEYQFVTDTYRLYALLSCLCSNPRQPTFHTSPHMKFMLRQVKAIDYSLPDDSNAAAAAGGTAPPRTRSRPSVYQERAALTARDENGNVVRAEELDSTLLTLYGHILFTGSSFLPALNYFFRAYALDDSNPLVLLSIALAYVHHALKRQADNRHYLIVQGLAFMHAYRRVRERGSIVERQEMEFNFARMWHSLGITHLAEEGYLRALELGEEIRAKHSGQEGEGFVEDFSREAAVALQGIYAVNGDLAAARKVTEKYLVI